MARRGLLVALIGLCALAAVSVASVTELRVARVALGASLFSIKPLALPPCS
jgi:hypothetical protein